MSRCYLFSRTLTSEGCLSIVLSDQGNCLQPLQERTFSEIRALQADCETWVVLPTELASLYTVELPWLGDKKARTALPFALEDQLAEPLSNLHFAFDKHYYQNNRYLVAVIAKSQLDALIDQLHEAKLEYQVLTLDWFSLESGEACLSETRLLINQSDFQGAISASLASVYLSTHTELEPWAAKDSLKLANIPTKPSNTETIAEFLALKLNQRPVINFCQGEYQLTGDADRIKKGYWLAGLAVLIWFLSFIVFEVIKIHRLNTHMTAADQQIAKIYKEFFPEAKQVISPKFRVKQLIDGKSGSAHSAFWRLMTQLAKAHRQHQVTIEQLHFQSNQLNLTVSAPDFAGLEGLQNQLQSQGVQVRQVQATTRDQQAVAILELK